MTRPIRVLFPKRRPTTNPYVIMLGEQLQRQPGIELVDLSYRTALAGGYDVIHLHWPEILLSGRTSSRRVAKEAAFTALLSRLRLRRQALVRTYHNIGLPSGLTRAQRGLLRRAERATAVWITLNEHSRPPGDAPVRLIPHGHYRSWYSRFPKSELVPGRIGYFGLIRRYKAVDRLIAAYRDAAADHPQLGLAVAGKPSTPELADELTRQASGDPRIDLRFEFLSDAELVAHVTSCEVIVLTHREMFNSGTALAALSLDRPVLLPRNNVNEELAAEVGEDWVLLYDEPLTSGDLVTAIARIAARPADGPGPDLSARDWDRAGEAHLAAYRAAVERVRGQA